MMADQRETYVVTPEDVAGFCVGTVTDALTGRVTATRRGSSVVLNEPLCMGCDSPVSDGPCGCVGEGS